jgi:hypothetical protein
MRVRLSVENPPSKALMRGAVFSGGFFAGLSFHRAAPRGFAVEAPAGGAHVFVFVGHAPLAEREIKPIADPSVPGCDQLFDLVLKGFPILDVLLLDRKPLRLGARRRRPRFQAAVAFPPKFAAAGRWPRSARARESREPTACAVRAPVDAPRSSSPTIALADRRHAFARSAARRRLASGRAALAFLPRSLHAAPSPIEPARRPRRRECFSDSVDMPTPALFYRRGRPGSLHRTGPGPQHRSIRRGISGGRPARPHRHPQTTPGGIRSYGGRADGGQSGTDSGIVYTSTDRAADARSKARRPGA